MTEEDTTRAQVLREVRHLLNRLADLEGAGKGHVDSEEWLLERVQELRLLCFSIQEFTSSLDLDQVLHRVMEELRRLLRVTACSVWLREVETGDLVCHQCVGPSCERVQGWRLSPALGIAGWVTRNGVGVIVPDTSQDVRHFKEIDQATGWEVRSILCVPLMVQGKVIGVIEVVAATTERFSQLDLVLAESLAGSAAIAIENARLYSIVQQELKERESLINELRGALAQVKTLRGLLPICAHCKKIRDDHGYWKQIEAYISDHTDADFSHGICPDCLKKCFSELHGAS
jgi:transcriptional regulator with GAF, ATPase, and Fis domain